MYEVLNFSLASRFPILSSWQISGLTCCKEIQGWFTEDHQVQNDSEEKLTQPGVDQIRVRFDP